MIEEVTSFLRNVGASIILPRYRRLRTEEIEEKGPADLVTIADREAEQAIAAHLLDLMPGSCVVGEEACSVDPRFLDRLHTGAVWVVDPIDGTGNFVAGRPPFATMVALLQDGEVVMSWIHDPLTGGTACAERGSGAWLDGERLAASAYGGEKLSGIVSRFCLPEERAPFVKRVEQEAARVTPTRRCAGAEYPMVAKGACDFAIYWRTLVWDHAPGSLLLREAGGIVCRLDGTDYSPVRPGVGLMLARSPDIADELLRLR
ncbi:inositol monophosphatase [Sphingomonas sp. MAH-20]|uniref:Inositol monophosphatase n=1 Tax=Sphingomonas horti TaxID=2682842 RepID=A0A6I4IXF1_9SPHN|nr:MULTISPECIES: inositol monophosphatase family protein [Sphingomonas]MBA2920523.1 inositol monophosphatase [Sphingomonas sp. CGMCC 1.13658]MVO76775.1 inositol monophosphatase [Sphingomonas horti]